MLQFKVQPQLDSFLQATLKPECVSTITDAICNLIKGGTNITYQIFKADSKYDQGFTLVLDRNDFIEIEPLKLNTWYPAERFDGNPDKHIMIEESVGKSYLTSKRTSLLNRTARFMYLSEN